MAEKKDNGEKKGKGGEEGKKDEKKNNNPNSNAIILKIDMHCEGCASKIIKCAKSFKGVETAKVEWEASKLTVEGKVDPTKLRERLQEKTKKKVELVSPQKPKKDMENKDSNTTTNNNNNNNGKNDSSKGQQGKKAADKKPKELPVITVVLKLGLHCQGCVQKIHKFVSKTSGVKSVTIEREKDLMTVTGAIDVKSLVESLKARMKRAVEIVSPKKEKEKGKDNEEKKEGNNANGNGEGGGNQKECGGNGNNSGNVDAGKMKGGGGGGNGSNAGGNKEEEENSMMGKMEGSRMGYYGIVGYPANSGYGYGYGYNGYHGYNVHAPQYFSDENPNACLVM